jgi:hypothetical protein
MTSISLWSTDHRCSFPCVVFVAFSSIPLCGWQPRLVKSRPPRPLGGSGAAERAQDFVFRGGIFGLEVEDFFNRH